MNSVLRFVGATLVIGAAYWFLHPLLWPVDRPSWVASLAWGAWMTACGTWITRRQRAGKSMDSPATSLIAGLALTGLGIACVVEFAGADGSRALLAGVAVTCLGLYCLGTGIQAWRVGRASATNTVESPS